MKCRQLEVIGCTVFATNQHSKHEGSLKADTVAGNRSLSMLCVMSMLYMALYRHSQISDVNCYHSQHAAQNVNNTPEGRHCPTRSGFITTYHVVSINAGEDLPPSEEAHEVVQCCENASEDRPIQSAAKDIACLTCATATLSCRTAVSQALLMVANKINKAALIVDSAVRRPTCSTTVLMPLHADTPGSLQTMQKSFLSCCLNCLLYIGAF